MKRICVFMGSSRGNRIEYVEAAGNLGKELARRKIDLVYGGANVGLMGMVADAVLQSGGNVIGVIPESIKHREIVKHDLSELHIVDSMQSRKTLMAELSDGFIALPGGMGTLDELVEMLVSIQLGFFAKPCGLLNVSEYFNSLIAFLEHMVAERFMQSVHREMLMIASEPGELLEHFMRYRPNHVGKWFNP